MIPSYANPAIIVVSVIAFILMYIDWRRVTKENHEWYRLYIISKVDPVPFQGGVILKAVRDGFNSESILQTLRDVHKDNHLTLQNLYGEWYQDLIKFL